MTTRCRNSRSLSLRVARSSGCCGGHARLLYSRNCRVTKALSRVVSREVGAELADSTLLTAMSDSDRRMPAQAETPDAATILQ